MILLCTNKVWGVIRSSSLHVTHVMCVVQSEPLNIVTDIKLDQESEINIKRLLPTPPCTSSW